MAITSSTRTAQLTQEVPGDTSAWITIPFRIFDESDLVVLKDSVLMNLDTDYTVDGVDAANCRIYILQDYLQLDVSRVVPQTQPYSFGSTEKLVSSDIEKALDRLTVIAQQIDAGV